MSAIRIATMLVISALLGSCGRRDSDKNACELDTQVSPSMLLAGEQSFAEFKKYERLFSDPSFRWVERNSGTGHGGLSVDRFKVRREVLGHSGDLEYVFYFRRLADMRFHPDNPSLFFETAKSKGLPASNLAEIVTGDVRYWAIRSGGNGEVLGVADERISRTFDACVYAHD